MNRVLGCRSNKSSDPFVVLTLEDEMRTDTPDQRKTEVRPNTLNPQFDQTFAFKMRPESHDIRLRVDVFDHDKIGSNDKIGCASFWQAGMTSRPRSFSSLVTPPCPWLGLMAWGVAGRLCWTCRRWSSKTVG